MTPQLITKIDYSGFYASGPLPTNRRSRSQDVVNKHA